MPRLPDYTSLGESPSPRSSLGKTSYRATHGAETAPGQALVKVGGTLVNIGEEVERENLRADNLRAEDAFTKLRAKQQELSIGDDGFTKKRGGDAVNKDLIKDYSKRFEDSINEISNELGNERQKSFFKRRADIGTLQYKQDMLGHVTKEKDVYAKQTFQGIIDTETSNAIERYQDPNGAAFALERINGAISMEAGRTGVAPELVQAMRRDASSKVNRGIIERHLANEDDLSATAQYKKIKGTLNSEDTIAVEKALEVGSTRGQGQRLADKFMDKHDNNFGLAVEEARKIKHPKVREAALNNIRQAKSDNEAAIKLNEDDAFTSAMQGIQEHGDVNKIPPDTLIRIGVDGQNTLEKMALEVREKRAPTTDMKVWNEFSEKSKDRNWLATLSEKDFSGYLFNLDEEKRDRASSLRDAAMKAAKGDAKAKDFLRNDATLRQMVLGKVIDAGLIDAKKKTSDYSQEDETILNNTVVEASKKLERIQVENKRKATVEEEAAVVNSLLMSHVKVKVEKPWYQFDSTKKISELTDMEKSAAYVPYKSVPIGNRDALKRMGVELGVKTEEISEDRISKAYTVFVTTKGLPRADREARINAILRGQ